MRRSRIRALGAAALVVAALTLADLEVTTTEPWAEIGRFARGVVTPDFGAPALLGEALALTIGVALLIGVLAGYLMWGLPTRDVARQLDDAKAQLTEERSRAAELQSQFADTESELKRAAEGLRRERELREKLEEMVSEGKK